MKKCLSFFLCLCLLIGFCTPAALAKGKKKTLDFSTTDRDGEKWTEDDLGDYKLIMLNFWEPWCPPCVGEMPELQELYEAYRERGFLILGIYSTEDMEEDVDQVLADCGTAYPILHYCKAFDKYQTGYVPTTIFANAKGEVLGDAEIGSKSYEEWEELILSFELLDDEVPEAAAPGGDSLTRPDGDGKTMLGAAG